MLSLRIFYTISLSCSLLLFAVPGQAAVYKWVDEDGHVNYSSTPPPAGHDAKRMQGIKATGPVVPDKKTSTEDSKKAGDKTKPADQAADKKTDEQQYTPEQRRKLCQNATKDLDTLAKSGRLRVKQADGSSVVMSDEEREKRRIQMSKMRDKHCK